jgi:hypothetical protein
MSFEAGSPSHVPPPAAGRLPLPRHPLATVVATSSTLLGQTAARSHDPQIDPARLSHSALPHLPCARTPLAAAAVSTTVPHASSPDHHFAPIEPRAYKRGTHTTRPSPCRPISAYGKRRRRPPLFCCCGLLSPDHHTTFLSQCAGPKEPPHPGEALRPTGPASLSLECHRCQDPFR